MNRDRTREPLLQVLARAMRAKADLQELAWQRPHVARIDEFPARATGRHQFGLVAAKSVLQHDGPAAHTGEIAIAPLHEAHDHRIEIDTPFGEVVLKARWMFLVQALGEDAVFDKSAQACGEHVAGDVQVLLQLVEPVSAEEHLTDDEDTPGIAEHIEGARDGARVGAGEWIAGGPRHIQNPNTSQLR